MGGRIAADARDVGGIVYGDRLGVLVPSMVLFCVYLFVLFEVLGALERFLAYLSGMSGCKRSNGGCIPRIYGV